MVKLKLPILKLPKLNFERTKNGNGRWSAKVTRESHSLDLEPGVFVKSNPEEIAVSIKHSADVSSNKKSTSRQAAMSMVNFYENRAGSNLTPEQVEKLEQIKIELRRLYDEEK